MFASSAPSNPVTIAVFISPHGFGHASRASAVMEALLRLDPALHFEIFGQTPAWFFDSLPAGSYSLHSIQTDVGLVQATPIVEDLPATLTALEVFTTSLPGSASQAARILRERYCRLVLCDISPLGIVAARQAGIPSVLVENFTWDWIYSAYTAGHLRFSGFAQTFRMWFSQADVHIQTEPVCDRQPNLPLFAPASRLPRHNPVEVKAMLNLPANRPIALISLGSLLEKFPVIETASRREDWTFLIPDSASSIELRGNLLLLPQHSDLSHPDLVGASDVLVAKSGYSTIAEAYACGIPFGYLNRAQFPESPRLEEFIQREMPALEILEIQLRNGAWVNRLDELRAIPRRPHPDSNGADCIARLIAAKLG